MAGVILERYLRAQAYLTIVREHAVQVKKLIGDSTIDKQIKKELTAFAKQAVKIDDLMTKRMGLIRKEFHDAMDDFTGFENL